MNLIIQCIKQDLHEYAKIATKNYISKNQITESEFINQGEINKITYDRLINKTIIASHNLINLMKILNKKFDYQLFDKELLDVL